MGSRLPDGTFSVDEVAAWRLFGAALSAQGCYGDEDAAFGIDALRAGKRASDPDRPRNPVGAALLAAGRRCGTTAAGLW